MEKFAEVVAKESGGKIKVQVYADSQIGDIQQLIAGMQLGTVDMAYLGTATPSLKDCGALNIGYLPYLFKSKQKATEIYNSPIFLDLYETARKHRARAFSLSPALARRAPSSPPRARSEAGRSERACALRIRPFRSFAIRSSRSG
jgi:TRAP-type C4-dicarboxylate transport system substrate-binding protein